MMTVLLMVELAILAIAVIFLWFLIERRLQAKWNGEIGEAPRIGQGIDVTSLSSRVARVRGNYEVILNAKRHNTDQSRYLLMKARKAVRQMSILSHPD